MKAVCDNRMMHTVNPRVIIKKKSLANEIIMEGKNTMLLNPKKQGKYKIKNNNKKRWDK